MGNVSSAVGILRQRGRVMAEMGSEVLSEAEGRTAMPAVLVETGFIDNPQDAGLLVEHREEMATAIARGVTDWGQVKA